MVKKDGEELRDSAAKAADREGRRSGTGALDARLKFLGALGLQVYHTLYFRSTRFVWGVAMKRPTAIVALGSLLVALSGYVYCRRFFGAFGLSVSDYIGPSDLLMIGLGLASDIFTLWLFTVALVAVIMVWSAFRRSEMLGDTSLLDELASRKATRFLLEPAAPPPDGHVAYVTQSVFALGVSTLAFLLLQQGYIASRYDVIDVVQAGERQVVDAPVVRQGAVAWTHAASFADASLLIRRVGLGADPIWARTTSREYFDLNGEDDELFVVRVHWRRGGGDFDFLARREGFGLRPLGPVLVDAR